MICPKCGNENNKKNSQFCKECGSPINLEVASINELGKEKRKHNILILIIIALIIAMAVIGTYTYMATTNNSILSESKNNISLGSTNNNIIENNAGQNRQSGYTYIGGVPFNIPNYYNPLNSTNEDGYVSETYIRENGDKISIIAGTKKSQSEIVAGMRSSGWNYKYDSSRNLYYLSHPTTHGYVYEYNGITVSILTDNLDDLHKVYVLN
ncbi:MAG: hypothetical protein ACRC1M_04915 [Methanobacteriaceae archaeon]